MTNATDQAATDIVGHYACEGGDYRGEVAIRDLGGSYAVHWTIGGSVHAGVGIRNGNFLAVSVAIPVTAVVLYEIHAGPSLQGRYCAFPSRGPVADEVLSFSHSLRSWESGDTLLANWSRDPFWYPATVIDKTDDDRYQVRFADGDEEWIGRSRMIAELLTVGDLVYHTRGLFHRDADGQRASTNLPPDEVEASRVASPCKIIGRDGDAIRLQYGDGATVTTSIEYIRTLAPREG